MLDYRLSIKTSLDEVVTPQTDYRLSNRDFTEILHESKEDFTKYTKNKALLWSKVCKKNDRLKWTVFRLFFIV